jgi:hypothetical protein
MLGSKRVRSGSAWALVLTAVVACSVTLLAGPADAAPVAAALALPPTGDILPGSFGGTAGGGAVTTGATSGVGDAAATAVVTDLGPASIIIAAGAYGLTKEWKYFHPSATGVATGSAGSTAGGGQWCAATCDNHDQYTVTNEMSATMTSTVATTATAGTVSVDVVNLDPAHASHEQVEWLTHGPSGYEICEVSPLSAAGASASYSVDVATLIADPACFAGTPTGPAGVTVIDDRGYSFGYDFSVGGPTGAVPVTHTVTSSLACSDGTTATSSATYQSTDIGPVTLDAPTCPVGVHPTGATITDSDGTTSTGIETWNPPPVQPFPDCLPGGTSSPCLLALQDFSVTNGWQQCGVDVDCTGYANPSGTPATQLRSVQTITGTGVGAGPQTFRCVWGPHEMPMSDCDPDAVPKGGTTAAPGLGDDTIEAPAPAGTPSACFPHGWAAFNPAEWVYKPIVCAARFLFIPDVAGVQTDMQGIGSAFDGSAIGVVFHAFSPLLGIVGQLSGGQPADCHGPEFGPVTFPGTTGQFAMHPLDACADLTQYILHIVEPLLSAFIYIGAFTIGARKLASTIGAQDLLPVTDA